MLTSLCVVHTLGNLGRFVSTLKVAAYVAFDPMEDWSVGKAYGYVRLLSLWRDRDHEVNTGTKILQN